MLGPDACPSSYSSSQSHSSYAGSEDQTHLHLSDVIIEKLEHFPSIVPAKGSCMLDFSIVLDSQESFLSSRGCSGD